MSVQRSDAMMTPAREITLSTSRSQSVSHSLSTSPTATFHSPPSSFGGAKHLQNSLTAPKQLKPFNTQDIKILLLENVNQSGRNILSEQGYQVEFLKSSLPEDELIQKIRYRGPNDKNFP